MPIEPLREQRQCVLKVGGCRSDSLKSSHPNPQDPRSQATQVPEGHPIAPTKFPKKRSAAQLIQRQALSQSATYASQEEDTFDQSRPEDGYWLGLTPECLMNNASHRPVIHRLHPSLPQVTGLQAPSVKPAN